MPTTPQLLVEIKKAEKPYRVLLVEDDKLMQTMGLAILKSMPNYQIDLAKTGEEALALTATIIYDIIYMDIGLPKIDGIEATQKIRENAKSPNQPTFITALTAHAYDEITQHCLTIIPNGSGSVGNKS